jgi:hypothetical protein
MTVNSFIFPRHSAQRLKCGVVIIRGKSKVFTGTTELAQAPAAKLWILESLLEWPIKPVSLEIESLEKSKFINFPS